MKGQCRVYEFKCLSWYSYSLQYPCISVLISTLISLLRRKEDGKIAKADDKLEFKVIEFSKTAKKIILSHSRVFEDVKKAEEAGKKKKVDEMAKKTGKKLKSSMEKTTLGDITDLVTSVRVP